jgi:hypothetical protein
MKPVQYLLLLALLLPAAACASARAATPPEDHPALLVPPAPPRAIDPLPVEPPAIEPVPDLPKDAPVNPPRPRPQREPNKPGANEKPEAKPPDTPTDPAGQPAAQPVPPLRAPGDPDGPEMTRQIAAAIERAKKMLGSLNTQTLNGDRRANYDNAMSFIKQAEEALKGNNLTNAKSLADRAETIARALTGG